jgi:tight adherence protein B
MTEFLPLLLVAALLAAVLASAVFVVRDLLERRRRHWAERWHDPDGESAVTLARQLAANRPAPGWRGWVDVAFQRMIQQSNLKLSVTQAVGIMALLAVTFGGLLVLWRDELWLAAVGAALGLLGPLLVYRYMHGRWRRQVQEQLPDALFLLGRSLRAGLSPEQSLAVVGEHGPRPLADEFLRCSAQIQLGLSAPAVLRLMGERLGLDDLNGMVSIVTMHRTTGGNLPFLLDRWAASTRDRNQFRGYFRAATALGRITAVALAGAGPALLIGYWVWQPDYIGRFARSAGGGVALAIAAGLEVVGCLWMYLLVRSDY